MNWPIIRERLIIGAAWVIPLVIFWGALGYALDRTFGR